LKNVNDYYLRIAEENGEFEMDLPPLDSNQFVGKFGFTHFALFEKIKYNHGNQVSNKLFKVTM
jgi:hypothetical protein